MKMAHRVGGNKKRAEQSRSREATLDTHVQVPDADLAVKAPGGHQAGDGGVKGDAPGGPAVAHQRM